MTNEKKYLKNLLFIIPLVGIIIYFIYPESEEVDPIKSEWLTFLHTIIITTGIWAGAITIVAFLWKKYPWEKYPIKHLIIEIVLIGAYTNTFALGLYHLQLYLKFVEPVKDITGHLFTTNLITFFITAIHEAIEFYNQWKAHFSKSVKLERDNIEAKFETLKAQINPHFLFNSLNSLTNIVHENKPAVDYIQNLSDFLRYTLKSRDIELVLARSELEMLDQYLKLQKARFGENLLISVDVGEKYYHYSVPPLVLQMLIENCIKHNVISAEKPLCIRVYANKQSLVVENTLQKKDSTDSTGQGLKNITERYKFFSGKEIEIKETSTSFIVTIPLLKVDI